MLIAFLISLFFAGEPDQFIIPKLEKYCNRHLEESSQDLLIPEVETFKEAAKNITKANQKNSKKFKKERLKQDLKEAQFENFINEYIDQYEYMDSLSMKSRQLFKQELSKEQWNEALDGVDKQINKHKKNFIKTSKKLNKKIHSLKDKAQRKIDNNGMNAKALEIIREFELNLTSTLDIYESDYYDLLIYLKDYDADFNTILAKRKKIIELRYDFYNHFRKAYFDLNKTLTPDEWKMIQKHFNSLF